MREIGTIETQVDKMLGTRRWRRYANPFPHVRAEDVFTRDCYKEIAVAYRTLVNTPGTFTRPYQHYDSLVAKLPSDSNNPLGIFAHKQWWHMLAGGLDMKVTHDVSVELHLHEPGSRSGRVHNDLNPGWFIGQAQGDTCNVADNRLCAYKSGISSITDTAPRRMVRALAMIFYLDNSVWHPGDGGETALFPAFTSQPEPAPFIVPPVNNSFLAFRCTPYSFHTFLSNRSAPRNAVIAWAHQPYDDTVAQWGEAAIVQWRDGSAS